MSLGMMVTRLAWMAHRLVSSNRPTKYTSLASCSANTAELWNRKSVLKSVRFLEQDAGMEAYGSVIPLISDNDGFLEEPLYRACNGEVSSRPQ